MFKPYTDVDECLPGNNNNCDVNAECYNKPGTYSCSCKTGYAGEGSAGTCKGEVFHFW